MAENQTKEDIDLHKSAIDDAVPNEGQGDGVADQDYEYEDHDKPAGVPGHTRTVQRRNVVKADEAIYNLSYHPGRVVSIVPCCAGKPAIMDCGLREKRLLTQSLYSSSLIPHLDSDKNGEKRNPSPVSIGEICSLIFTTLRRLTTSLISSSRTPHLKGFSTLPELSSRFNKSG